MPDSNKNQALSNIKERFALEVSDAYIKKALGKKWRDHKSILKKEYFKKPISLEQKLQNVPPGMLRYQWEDAVRFWNSKKGEEASSGQKVGRLQLFDITHRKKDGTPMTSEAAEIMITELLMKFWVQKGMVGLDFKDLVLTRPNILDPPRTNTCLPGVKVKLKFRG
ncbi:hypothetical protein V6Z11_A08G116700 [Gossypium hirsutum]